MAHACRVRHNASGPRLYGSVYRYSLPWCTSQMHCSACQHKSHQGLTASLGQYQPYKQPLLGINQQQGESSTQDANV